MENQEDPIITTQDTIPPMLTDDATELIRQTNFQTQFPDLDWTQFERQLECPNVIDYYVYYRNWTTNDIYACHKLSHKWFIPSNTIQLKMNCMTGMWKIPDTGIPSGFP